MDGDAVGEHTLSFALEPGRTALVVIDMQYASASRGAGFGRWLEENGRADEGAYRFDRIESLLVPNIRRLLDAFRAVELPCVFVRLGAQMSGCRDLIPHIRTLETAFGNVSGQREYEILDELEPRPGEPVVTKLSASAFTSSGFDALLRNLEVTTLVFVGVSTSQCVDLTARDAADRGYRCVIVEDAVAEDRHEWHTATLEQFERLFGAVGATDDVLRDVAELAARTP
ncbi:MAG: cysteine hydrolase family protein [Gaiellaceae bacterium]